MDSKQILDREFLEIRSKLLTVAASFDRIERAAGDVGDDPRMQLFRKALDIWNLKAATAPKNFNVCFPMNTTPNGKQNTVFLSPPVLHS